MYKNSPVCYLYTWLLQKKNCYIVQQRPRAKASTEYKKRKTILLIRTHQLNQTKWMHHVYTKNRNFLPGHVRYFFSKQNKHTHKIGLWVMFLSLFWSFLCFFFFRFCLFFFFFHFMAIRPSGSIRFESKRKCCGFFASFKIFNSCIFDFHHPISRWKGSEKSL